MVKINKKKKVTCKVKSNKKNNKPKFDNLGSVFVSLLKKFN